METHLAAGSTGGGCTTCTLCAHTAGLKCGRPPFLTWQKMEEDGTDRLQRADTDREAATSERTLPAPLADKQTDT